MFSCRVGIIINSAPDVSVSAIKILACSASTRSWFWTLFRVSSGNHTLSLVGDCRVASNETGRLKLRKDFLAKAQRKFTEGLSMKPSQPSGPEVTFFFLISKGPCVLLIASHCTSAFVFSQHKGKEQRSEGGEKGKKE